MRIACLVAIVLWASTAALAQGQVTVEVRPSEIPVAPWDQKAEARVILHNGDNQTITGATLKAGISNDGITTVIDPAPAPRLQQHDSYAWSVPLNISAARVPGSIELDVEYSVNGSP